MSDNPENFCDYKKQACEKTVSSTEAGEVSCWALICRMAKVGGTEPKIDTRRVAASYFYTITPEYAAERLSLNYLLGFVPVHTCNSCLGLLRSHIRQAEAK